MAPRRLRATARAAMDVFSCRPDSGLRAHRISAGGVAYLNEADHRERWRGGRICWVPSGARWCCAASSWWTLPEVSRGMLGELLMRGPNVMKGYWSNPGATAEACAVAGCIRATPPDRRRRIVYLHDRLKDMVVSGGVNIYPREVENALLEHEHIPDVAVIGVPDDKWGEALMAFCVLRSGTKPSDDELIAFCRDRIGGFKIPRRYEFVGGLPRNASGKVLKRILRAPYLGRRRARHRLNRL